MRFVKDFRIISVPLLYGGDGVHSFYIKQHINREISNSKSSKTMFVGNIDWQLTNTNAEVEENLRLMFERFGSIESISVGEIPAGSNITTRFAHIEYGSKSDLKLALDASEAEYIEAGQQLINLRREQWNTKIQPSKTLTYNLKRAYSLVDEDPVALQEEVDLYMREFEENELTAKLKREKALNTVDADGFMPVKNRSKRGITPEMRETNEKLTNSSNYASNNPQSDAHRRKKKATELKNFYRFQIREQKVAKIDALRKKFEEDKVRVAALKESRKFKPF